MRTTCAHSFTPWFKRSRLTLYLRWTNSSKGGQPDVLVITTTTAFRTESISVEILAHRYYVPKRWDKSQSTLKHSNVE